MNDVARQIWASSHRDRYYKFSIDEEDTVEYVHLSDNLAQKLELLMIRIAKKEELGPIDRETASKILEWLNKNDND